MVATKLLIAALLGGLASCAHATASQTGFLQGDALVTRSVECVTLLIAGTTYEPVGLPDSLALVGLRLRVIGFVRADGASVCQAGPLLDLISVVRA